MHTTKISTINYNKDVQNTIFHHNGGFDGDIIINDCKGNEITIPNEAILKFVAKQVVNAKIIELEDASFKDILKL